MQCYFNILYFMLYLEEKQHMQQHYFAQNIGKGRKRGSKLSRQLYVPTQKDPPPPSPQPCNLPNNLPSAASSDNRNCSSTVNLGSDQGSRWWENNLPFYLEVTDEKRVCSSCNCDILFRLPPPHNLVLTHQERYEFPCGPSTDKWSVKRLTNKATRKRFYHCNVDCLRNRFSELYFNATPLIITANAAPLKYFITKVITHPSL